MRKQRKTVKGDQIRIMWSVSRAKDFQFLLKAVDDILSHIQ